MPHKCWQCQQSAEGQFFTGPGGQQGEFYCQACLDAWSSDAGPSNKSTTQGVGAGEEAKTMGSDLSEQTHGPTRNGQGQFKSHSMNGISEPVYKSRQRDAVRSTNSKLDKLATKFDISSVVISFDQNSGCNIRYVCYLMPLILKPAGSYADVSGSLRIELLLVGLMW